MPFAGVLTVSGAMLMQASKLSETLAELRYGLIVKGRVIGALVLREIHTINGNSRLGYLWVLIQTLFGIGVFWGVRYFMGAGQAPHGMNMAIFLASGFGLWNIFTSGVNRCMTAVEGNRALLTFPQVTELDVMISRVIVTSATQVVAVSMIIFAAILMMNEPFLLGNVSLLLFLLIVVPMMTLGVGMTLSSLAIFVPALTKLVPMAFRILFFISGVFFSVSAFSQSVAEILLLNPILHAIELARMSLHSPYMVQGISWMYVLAFAVVSCGIGGYLERYVRTRRRDE